MAAVAAQVVELLHTSLRTHDGVPACASIQLFKTHRFGDLPPAARQSAVERVGWEPAPSATALVTLAWGGSSGIPAEWLAVPLTNEGTVDASPFLRAVLAALHIGPAELVDPAVAQTNELHRRPYGIFHVPDATAFDAPLSSDGAQCVARTRTCSIVALGGGLLSGDVFLLVLCSRVPISSPVAKLLKALTPAVKTALVPMTFTVFGGREDP